MYRCCTYRLQLVQGSSQWDPPRGSFEGQGFQDNLLQAQNSGKQADITGDGLASKINVHLVLKMARDIMSNKKDFYSVCGMKKGMFQVDMTLKKIMVGTIKQKRLFREVVQFPSMTVLRFNKTKPRASLSDLRAHPPACRRLNGDLL